MKMKKGIIFAIAMLILMLGIGSVNAQTCAISTGIGHRLLADTDCDRVPDIEDNCPFASNPSQRDAEHNSLGDACDLYIESIATSPSDFVYNGRAFNTLVTFYNHRDYNMRNVKVRLIMPQLGIESVQYVDNFEVCSANTVEFFLRAPMCVPTGDYAIITEASFINAYGETEVIPGTTSIRVVADNYCEMVLANGQEIGNTFIDVMQFQDVYKGSEAVFPIKITNRESADKEYIISVTGLGGWGSARLSPGSLIIVPSGAQRAADLYVGADSSASPGERAFVVSVQSGEEIQRFLLIANVKESGKDSSADKSFMLFFGLKVLIIGGLVLLIAIALVVGFLKYLESVRSEPTQYY